MRTQMQEVVGNGNCSKGVVEEEEHLSVVPLFIVVKTNDENIYFVNNKVNDQLLFVPALSPIFWDHQSMNIVKHEQ